MATALSRVVRAGEEALPRVILHATRSMHRSAVITRGGAVAAVANAMVRGMPWHAAATGAERHLRAGIALAHPRLFATSVMPEDIIQRRLGKHFDADALSDITTLLASIASKADVTKHPERCNYDAYCKLASILPSRKCPEQLPLYVQAISNIATLRDTFGMEAAINLAGDEKSRWKTLGKAPLSPENMALMTGYITALSDEFGIAYLRSQYPKLEGYIDAPEIQDACFQAVADVVTRGTTAPRLLALAQRWERNQWSLKTKLACVEKVADIVTSEKPWASLLAEGALPDNKLILDNGNEVRVSAITNRDALRSHGFHLHNYMRSAVKATSMEAQFRLGEHVLFDVSVRGQRYTMTLNIAQKDGSTTVSIFEFKGKHNSQPPEEACKISEEIVAKINDGTLKINPDFKVIKTDLRPDNADHHYLLYLALKDAGVVTGKGKGKSRGLLPESFPTDITHSSQLYSKVERSEIKFRDSNFVSSTDVKTPHFLGRALQPIVSDMYAMDRRRRFPQPAIRLGEGAKDWAGAVQEEEKVAANEGRV